MRYYILQLSPRIIYAYILQSMLKKELEYSYAKKTYLKIKLSNEKKAFAMEMSLRPCFYKARPQDIQMQIRHNSFKLAPISSTKQEPDYVLQLRKKCLHSSLILTALQDTACQYRSSINRKFLSVEFIKKREQNKMVANYKLKLRPSPFKYF